MSDAILTQEQIESKSLELTSRSFEAFGEDIACMFGVEISGKDLDVKEVHVEDLKKQYRKLVALCPVHSTGTMQGTFHIILDQEAFFTLAGILVVQPEKIIIQNRKQGNGETAQEMSDAIGEVANLMVGAFDRIFRQEIPGHFSLAKTFIGSPWTKLEELGLSEAVPYIVASYETTIDKFPPFLSTVLFARDIFVPAAPVEKPKELEEESEKQVAAQETVEPQTQADQKLQSPQNVDENTAGSTDNAASIDESAPPETAGPVSESIRKMTSSPAILPGDDIQEQISLARKVQHNSVADIMCKEVVWLGSDETVEAALAKCRQAATDYVLVGNGEHIEGIVSKSDLRGATSPYLMPVLSQWRRPLDLASLNIRLKWIMSAPVETIRGGSSIASAARAMNHHHFKALPVIDDSGRVIGILTAYELLQFMAILA